MVICPLNYSPRGVGVLRKWGRRTCGLRPLRGIRDTHRCFTHWFSPHSTLSLMFSLVPIIPCISAELFTLTNKAISILFTQWLMTIFTPTRVHPGQAAFPYIRLSVGKCPIVICREELGTTVLALTFRAQHRDSSAWVVPLDSVAQDGGRCCKGYKRKEGMGHHDPSRSCWSCWQNQAKT